MNYKITKKQHQYLCTLEFNEYVFGSRLHGIATEKSDTDLIRVISDEFYEKFNTNAKYLPNIHSFQYDDVANDTQYVWLTERQFYHNLFSGDGNMIADVVILSGEFNDPMFLTRTYKVIKGYLGVAKRDLKLHRNKEKKRFHAYRSLYMAERLIDNELPYVDDIITLYEEETPCADYLFSEEKRLRNILNDMLNSQVITMYPLFKESDSLVETMVMCNNLPEFKY